MYTRKERRKFARQLGLTGTGTKQKQEIRSRSMEAGKQIHLQFLADNESRMREAAAEREAKQLASLIESVGEDMAHSMIANNKLVQKERAEKLAKKKLRGL